MLRRRCSPTSACRRSAAPSGRNCPRIVAVRIGPVDRALAERERQNSESLKPSVADSVSQSVAGQTASISTPARALRRVLNDRVAAEATESSAPAVRHLLVKQRDVHRRRAVEERAFAPSSKASRARRRTRARRLSAERGSLRPPDLKPRSSGVEVDRVRPLPEEAHLRVTATRHGSPFDVTLGADEMNPLPVPGLTVRSQLGVLSLAREADACLELPAIDRPEPPPRVPKPADDRDPAPTHRRRRLANPRIDEAERADLHGRPDERVERRRRTPASFDLIGDELSEHRQIETRSRDPAVGDRAVLVEERRSRISLVAERESRTGCPDSEGPRRCGSSRGASKVICGL